MFGFAKRLVKQAEEIIAPDHSSNDESTPKFGFRVLYTAEGSPARDAGLEALFDYIVAVNGHALEMVKKVSHSEAGARIEVDEVPVAEFKKLLAETPGASTELRVWSAKGRHTRTAYMAVGDDLGLEVQWTPTSAADAVWHVLDVHPGSPAEQAGLVSHEDYIVGSEQGLLEQGGGETLLGKAISQVASSSADGGLTLLVYNHDFDTVRPVRIIPKDDGKGNKLLGCGVGFGFLHRLPEVTNVHLPAGDTLFDEASSLALPPNVAPPMPQNESPYTTPQKLPLPSHHHHHHHAKSKNTGDLSAYFEEQAKISRERDTPGDTPARTGKETAAPPPPKSTSTTTSS